eukprot:1928_1
MAKKHKIDLESQQPIPPEPSSVWDHLLKGDVWSIVTCMVVFFLLFAGGFAIYYMSSDVPEVTDTSAASTESDDNTWTDLGTGADPTTTMPGRPGPDFTSAGFIEEIFRFFTTEKPHFCQPPHLGQIFGRAAVPLYNHAEAKCKGRESGATCEVPCLGVSTLVGSQPVVLRCSKATE